MLPVAQLGEETSRPEATRESRLRGQNRDVNVSVYKHVVNSFRRSGGVQRSACSTGNVRDVDNKGGVVFLALKRVPWRRRRAGTRWRAVAFVFHVERRRHREQREWSVLLCGEAGVVAPTHSRTRWRAVRDHQSSMGAAVQGRLTSSVLDGHRPRGVYRRLLWSDASRVNALFSM